MTRAARAPEAAVPTCAALAREAPSVAAQEQGLRSEDRPRRLGLSRVRGQCPQNPARAGHPVLYEVALALEEPSACLN